jgi:hypothetical protein
MAKERDKEPLTRCEEYRIKEGIKEKKIEAKNVGKPVFW